MESQYAENIKNGLKVEVLSNSNKIVRGIVDEVLSKNSYQMYGVMVRLKSGEIGRVQKIVYSDGEKNEKNFSEIEKLMLSGESLNVEFKSSALWSLDYTNEDIHKSKSYEVHSHKQKASKVIIAKSICALLNSEGGSLIIGIKEKKDTGQKSNLTLQSKASSQLDFSPISPSPKQTPEGLGDENIFEITGIQDELKKLVDSSKDGYRRMIMDDVLRSYFPSKIYNHINDYIKIEFIDVVVNEVNRILCWIRIRRSDVKVFLQLVGKEVFMIRTDTQSRALEGEELVDYCIKRFK
ncbi:putative DNA binding domain-containing protein [Candidatus Pacearchaeota archaeon]|nr:putative DNA binding domain-containing protein [Candidatus Pacearchaeota archaeon]